jgi:hypothetical protein
MTTVQQAGDGSWQVVQWSVTFSKSQQNGGQSQDFIVLICG